MTKKLNILMIADIFFPDVRGGSGRVVFEVSRGLAKKGHNLTVLTRRKDKNLLPDEEMHGFKVYRYNIGSTHPAGFLFSSLKNTYKLVKSLSKDIRFDCLILNQPLSALGALMVRKFKHIPKIYFFHSSWPEEYHTKKQRNDIGLVLRRWIEKKVLSKSQMVIPASKYSKDKIKRLYPKLSLNIKIIPNGVDVEKFKPTNNKTIIKGELDIALDKKVLFTVRNLTPRMGLESLIEAMVKVKEDHKDILLIIGGIGRLKQQLETLTASLGLEDSVIFTGNIEESDLPLYYRAADFFILPTKTLEGFGLVTLEALACGIPVLGTPVGATVEILKQLDERLLFKGTDAGSMAKLISEYLGKPKNQINELKQRCRQFAVDNYSWEKLTSSLEKVLTDVLS
ncbi:MAG: glycosyltransferase family 4 protein [Omnitrophica bacterium]|nr:glycosyltransferase family 4 protein [Candidatus Omnitrophota bacterium]